jgi:ubiquinone/menaquinone biosynthesis C-methylase UbiE
MTESPYRDPLVADVYRRIAVPTHFVPPARDLAAMLAIAQGETVLDVGSGTGAFAGAASAMAPDVFVVAVDRAVAMLRASTATRSRRAAAESPGLPFADGRFDAVGASFVLSHCRDYAASLADMVRVCRPGGRIGITAWGTMTNAPGRLWREIVDTSVAPDVLQRAFRAAVPWEDWLSIATNLEMALHQADLTAVRAETREYTIRMAPDAFLEMKMAGVEGRLVRQFGGEAAWRDFTARIAAAFQKQFPDTVTFSRDVHFAVGMK